jgi:predicted nucleic acid-binding protein
VIAYVDASILLRVILGQPGRLRQWRQIEVGIASTLVELECLRTLDRLRLRTGLPDEALAERREAVYRLTGEMRMVDVNTPVLQRAAQPFPTPLGTLDALHLSTALVWRETQDQDPVMATHDRALAIAARACGFRVLGV